MKKNLFFALAAVAVVFASCEQKPVEPTEKAVLKLSQNYAEIGIDEEIRLRTTVTPAGTNLAVVYESTDPEVVTVSGSGLVTGVALGEAWIKVSAANAEGDSCMIIVSDMAVYNSFNILDYGLFGDFEPIEGTDTVFTLSIGDCVCKLNYIHCYAWDGNANFVSGVGFAGDGWVMSIDDLPVYTIEKCEENPRYEGYYLSTGGFAVLEQEDDVVREAIARPGKMDIQSCGDLVSAQYSSDTTLHPDFDLWEELNYGAFLTEPFANGLGINYGFFSGKIHQVLFYDAVKSRVNPQEDSIPTMWAIDLDFASLQGDRLWGFRVDTALYNATYVEGEGGEIKLIEPYDYKTVHRVFDEDGLFEEEEEEAPARMAARKQAPVRELGDPKKLHLGVYLDKNGKVIPSTDRVYKK